MTLDTVTIELIITACQMDADDIWMQGDLEITLNGEKPYADSDIINETEFLKSLARDGEFDIFSCSCGDPACSGWERGIQVLHTDKTIRWTNPNNGKTWCFSKEKAENDLTDVWQQLENYKTFFKEKGIRYVGVGYSNIADL